MTQEMPRDSEREVMPSIGRSSEDLVRPLDRGEPSAKPSWLRGLRLSVTKFSYVRQQGEEAP